MENRTKNTTRNIIFGLINKAISIILPFISRTVLIYYLGTECLGLNSLFTSILQVLNLSELGISGALVFSMYKPIAEKNNKKVSELLNFYKNCYRVIGGIVLIIGIILLPFLKNFISGEIPSDINIYVIYLIYLINSVISYLFFSYKQSIIIASQRNDLISKVNSILIVVQNLLQMIILLMFKNYYMYIVVLPIITLLNNFAILIITNKYYPQYKAHGKLDKKDLSEIKKNVGGMIFLKIGSVVLSSVDNIVISAFLGVYVLGVYNNYFYIVSTLMGILSIFLDALKSSVGNSIVIDSKNKNFEDFKKFNFIYMWIVSWFTVCFMCLAQNFIYLWLGEKYMLDEKIVFVFAMYLFVHKWGDMLYVYQEAKGLWWENRYVQLIGAIVNLSLNLILVRVIGLYGILISTIISVLFVLNIGFFKVLFKYYFDTKEWKKEYLVKQIMYFISTFIICVISYFICNFFGYSIIMFVLKIIILIIVPNLLLLIFYFKLPEFKNAFYFIYTNFITNAIRKVKNNV